MTSEANKAEALTRVRKALLKIPIDADNGYIMCNTEDGHALHRCGEDTIYGSESRPNSLQRSCA